MEAVVAGRDLRPFLSSLQCLGKAGDDLFFEADDEKITMRALNSSQSAFLSVTLTANDECPGRGFFKTYKPPEGTLKCKLLTKVVLNSFRSLKGVKELSLLYDTESNHLLIFRFVCDHGRSK